MRHAIDVDGTLEILKPHHLDALKHQRNITKEGMWSEAELNAIGIYHITDGTHDAFEKREIGKSYSLVNDKAVETIHGKPSNITHDNQGIFKGLENPFQAGRYHSLAGYDIPYCLEISARSVERDIIMAIRHKEFPVIGVQFHPESILTPIGGLIIENLIKTLGK